jgi:hypothetical protein
MFDSLFPRFTFSTDKVVLVLDKCLISEHIVIDCDTIVLPQWIIELNTDEFEPSVRENMVLVVDIPTILLTAVPGSRFTIRRCIAHLTTSEDANTNSIICGTYKHPTRIFSIVFAIRLVTEQIQHPDSVYDETISEMV